MGWWVGWGLRRDKGLQASVLSRELAGKGWGLPAASRTQMGTCPQQARAPTCFSGQLYGWACWEVRCAPQG